MTPTGPMPEMTQFANDPERDEGEMEYPLLADAEEEEFVELWAGDPGNQGA